MKIGPDITDKNKGKGYGRTSPIYVGEPAKETETETETETVKKKTTKKKTSSK